MLGPANREYRMLNEILVTAKPRPVAMYRAPPKVKLLAIECDDICVAKTSNAGDADANCFASRLMALTVPRSTSSVHNISIIAQVRESRKYTLHEQRKESDHEHQEDTDDTTVDPLEYRTEVVAPAGTEELAGARVLADRYLRVQRTEEDH